MKLGVYLHLGPLWGGNWLETLAKAKTLHDAGVRHVFACNAAVDTVAMAKGDAAWLSAWKTQVDERLRAFDDFGLTVGVRPLSLCTEQVVLPMQEVLVTGAQPTTTGKQYAPDFTLRRTTIDAAKTLTLGDHYLYAGHEVHKVLDAKMRSWVVEQLGPRTIFYYGHRGLWRKYGTDFGDGDLPHVIHVALNAAGPEDDSAVGEGVVPRDCTAKQIGDFCEAVSKRLVSFAAPKFHAHINVTAATPSARMVAMAYEAREGRQFSVLMFRNVDDMGQTIHEVPANVLEAIKELDGVV